MKRMSDHNHAHEVSFDADHRKPLTIVLCLSVLILVIEVIGAILSGSLSLLADAGHVLTDNVGLILALVGANLMRRPATPERTWGFRRMEVLAAAGQALLLLAVGVFVLVEAIRRFFEPEVINPTIMVTFASIALVGNIAALLVMSKVQNGNLNTKAALLEVINDALGAVAVIVASVLIMTTGWIYADAVVSVAIAGLIMPRSWRLLASTLNVLLESTPKHISVEKLRSHLADTSGVVEVHDLHATTVGSNLPVVTAHLIVEEDYFSNGKLPTLLREVQNCLHGHFDVEHSTIQFEPVGHRQTEGSTHP